LLDGHLECGGWPPLIERAAGQIAFGRPLLTNAFRAVVTEAIVAQALGERWVHCAADYHPYDFERDDGIALELKQSAARQSWARDGDKPTRSSFDIANRTGRYLDGAWVSADRRWADIYVFAHHPRTDTMTDHREPEQWDFYVVQERHLPTQGTLSLGRILQLAHRTSFVDLALMVNKSADILRTLC
jgi:hypothetical protein